MKIIVYHTSRLIALIFLLCPLVTWAQPANYIKVSSVNPAYFTDSNGAPWIPVEISTPIYFNKKDNPETAFKQYEQLFKVFSQNGGTSVRLWMAPGNFFEVEDSIPGKYNQQGLDNLMRLTIIAAKYKLRLKVCLEITRTFEPAGPFTKKGYAKEKGGPLSSFKDYLNTQQGRQLYLNRAKQYAKRFAGNPTIYCWEVWNEINAVSEGDWNDFAVQMLREFKVLFPKQLSTVSMGSLDGPYAYQSYQQYFRIPQNDIFMVHRYIDPGATAKICLAPVDVAMADAVQYMRSHVQRKPVFVNETGAVEARHTTQSHYYALDTAGVILHDMLFTPFFCGAAGPGSMWHYWVYIKPNNLWYHYQRFTRAIKGINVLREGFIPDAFQLANANFYALKGKYTTLVWCKSTLSTYKTELNAPGRIQPVHTMPFNLSRLKVDVSKVKQVILYNPWTNVTQVLKLSRGIIELPAFRRSIVLRVSY